MSTVKIYKLIDPNTNMVKYVGKTVASLAKRLCNHIDNAKNNKHNKHLSNWILKLLSENKKPIIELIEECNNETWIEKEKYWISFYSNLVNLTLGGDGALGFCHTPETIEKLRLVNKGRKHTEEFKKQVSDRHKGKILSKEQRDKIGNANRGKKATEETISKLSESHKGIQQSEESKLKRSETIKEWWRLRKLNKDIVETE